MIKKIIIPVTVGLIGVIALILILNKNNKVEAVYNNGQIGIVTDTSKIKIDNEDLEAYKTVSSLVTINYESFDIDNKYSNTITLNDEHIIPLKASVNKNSEFIKNSITILGLNIKNGELKLTINTGKYQTENQNTFSLRNIYLTIGNKNIWSNEYPQDEYLNEPINFGETDLNDDMRFNYNSSETLTFSIDKKLLDTYGLILAEKYHKENIKVKSNNKEITINNKSYINIESSIVNGETVSDSKLLTVSQPDSIKSLKVKMDGVEIPNNLQLTKGAWASGEHELTIEAVNEYGFSQTKKINFTLADSAFDLSDSLSYTLYKSGVATSLFSGITDLGVITNDLSQVKTLDDTYLSTPYSGHPVVSFVVYDGDKTSLIWKGKAHIGRTVFMQIFNHNTSLWETVSTKKVTEATTITLGYDYKEAPQYVKDNKVYVRISSVLPNPNLDNITNSIYHITDIQYINQYITKSGVDSVLGKQGLQAFNDMIDYVVDNFDLGNLSYLLLTGDYVQQQKGVTPEEWVNFKNYFLDPLLDSGLPFGVSSGNHDIGAISSYQPEGTNGLDDVLVYDYYNEYLGQHVFENYDYYGGTYNNNRSHYDILSIDGHEFLFLYLGWGSSTPGVHVSKQDIDWAKTVLEQYPDKTVILATHEYLSNKGIRNLTGEYVYQTLVKEYANIKFVFSGHINGTAKKIDAIDDNGDGVSDRLVLQLLTDFQEEENLYGASFIRRIGLDYLNNMMYFDIYSPYFNDYDIKLTKNNQYAVESKEFYYPFDLTNSGYGLLTDYFG